MRSTTEQGYGYPHQKERERIARRVERGTEACARCGNLIVPGTPWHLDHADDRGGYLGPSHARCNEIAGRLKQIQTTKPVRPWRSEDW